MPITALSYGPRKGLFRTPPDWGVILRTWLSQRGTEAVFTSRIQTPVS